MAGHGWVQLLRMSYLARPRRSRLVDAHVDRALAADAATVYDADAKDALSVIVRDLVYDRARAIAFSRKSRSKISELS